LSKERNILREGISSIGGRLVSLLSTTTFREQNNICGKDRIFSHPSPAPFNLRERAKMEDQFGKVTFFGKLKEIAQI